MRAVVTLAFILSGLLAYSAARVTTVPGEVILPLFEQVKEGKIPRMCVIHMLNVYSGKVSEKSDRGSRTRKQIEQLEDRVLVPIIEEGLDEVELLKSEAVFQGRRIVGAKITVDIDSPGDPNQILQYYFYRYSKQWYLAGHLRTNNKAKQDFTWICEEPKQSARSWAEGGD